MMYWFNVINNIVICFFVYFCDFVGIVFFNIKKYSSTYT